ncbi:hypothetical protein FBZ89_10680 [Nitrospirillum amazonense]|uniref:NlpC/P60 domain-containing protein n=1 Tax=Nitrospirillum amazonense TaxID=28077 RepID=A0A560FGE5_9PROT|nr:hypothetical protein [Nitrospirillum amazonense]TWB20681.1 hypothetical protein FBZ89_10680 [Nitrospirillum amazonense]
MTDIPAVGGEAAQRAAVVAEAFSWVGTPYHQLADVKGAGVDCSMLLVRVFVDTGVLPPFDPRPYPPDWHLHRSDERYIDWAARFGRPFDPAERPPQAGDVVLARFGRCFSHGAVMTGRFELVHAYARDGRCVVGDLRQLPFLDRPLIFYSLWG